MAERLLPPHRDGRGKPVVAVDHDDREARAGIDHLTKLTCDDPICRCTGERSHALSLASSVSCFGWNQRGVSAWGLAQCRDTDDTNCGSGDTRTIRWMVKMARSETFQMSIDCPRTPAAVRMAARDCADRASSVAKEDYGSCISLGNRPRAAGCGIAAAVLYSVNPGASKYVGAPASRGCCWCN